MMEALENMSKANKIIKDIGNINRMQAGLV